MGLLLIRTMDRGARTLRFRDDLRESALPSPQLLWSVCWSVPQGRKDSIQPLPATQVMTACGKLQEESLAWTVVTEPGRLF